MNRVCNFFGILLIIGLFSSCIKPDTFPNEPEIVSVQLSTNSILNFQDELEVFIKFQDGDGDLGVGSDPDLEDDLFITDSRTGFVYTFRIPEIEPQGSVDDITGEIKVAIQSNCCIFEDQPYCVPTPNFPDLDVFQLEVKLRDRSLTWSNSVLSENITIRCNE